LVQAFKLSDPAPVGSDYFGESVALSEDGTTALVGVPYAICPATARECGAVYFLRRSAAGWAVSQKILSPSGTTGGRFGIAVALSGVGQSALVGADCSECLAGPRDGSASLFRWKAGRGWRPETTFSPPAGSHPPLRFGHATALSGSGRTGAVGVPVDGGPGCQVCGAAYLYNALKAGSEGKP
jgi:hypothetical protein